MLAFDARDWLWYGAALLESAALWGSLLDGGSAAASRWLARSRSLLFGAGARQRRYFYDQFGTYLNADAVLFGAAFPAQPPVRSTPRSGALAGHLLCRSSVSSRSRRRPQWLRPRDAATLAASPARFSSLLSCLARSGRPRRRRRIIWFHAMGGSLVTRARRQTFHVEPGIRRPCTQCLGPAARRNVLLVTKGVTSTPCAWTGTDCRRSRSPIGKRKPPASPRCARTARPPRHFVRRAFCPYSMTETRDAIPHRQLVFDYAHAAGYDTAGRASINVRTLRIRARPAGVPALRRDGTHTTPTSTWALATTSCRRVKRGCRCRDWFAMIHYSAPTTSIPTTSPFNRRAPAVAVRTASS